MPKRNKKFTSSPPLSIDERAELAVERMSDEARLAMRGTRRATPKITKELRKLGCVNKRSNGRTCVGLRVSVLLGGDVMPRSNTWWAAPEGVVSTSNRTQRYA